ncbi:MAG: hypothetical protein D8M59_08080 [Planctomycetes bacterium]|nr:hypothetical protein [Planctomycetota bacterium]
MFVGGTALGQVGSTSLSAPQGESKAIVYGKLLSNYLQTVEFNEIPLKNVVEFLSQMGDIDILAKWAEDFSSEGLDPEKSITLQLRKPTPLLTVLELVMDQATEEETTWILGEGYVEVGTKDMLNKNKYVMIYPVRELLFEPTGFDNAPQMDLSRSQNFGSGSGGSSGGSGQSLFNNQGSGSGRQNQIQRSSEDELADELIDILTTIVDPYQWERNGGEGGSIRYFRGSLLINASDYLHRQVGGYPFAPARVRSQQLSSTIVAPRYVSLTGSVGFSRVIDIAETEVPILVGGKVVRSGGGG